MQMVKLKKIVLILQSIELKINGIAIIVMIGYCNVVCGEMDRQI